MAFMLVAVMIFFAMVGLIYFSISMANLQSEVADLRREEAREIVRKLSGTPELAFTSSTDCAVCLDMDKALMLNENNKYDGFWNIDYLMIEKIMPDSPDVKCTRANYPNCNKIVIVDKTNGNLGGTKTAFVALARWDNNKNTFVYELGRLHASGVNLDD
jgi:hypothetical protein